MCNVAKLPIYLATKGSPRLTRESSSDRLASWANFLDTEGLIMATASPTRVAIYARASKDCGEQDLGNELSQLRRWCAYERCVITGVYLDYEGGANGPDRRPELTRLLADASRGQFDLVLVWSVDCFSRKRMGATVVDNTASPAAWR
jgi:predicted site-specific integrase-resolvase